MVQIEAKADRYRWVILGVLWITYLVVFLNRLSVGPLGPFLKEDLGLTSTQVGLVMSAAAFGYMLTMFPVGWLVDRIGARWLIISGEWVAGASMMALFFVPSYGTLLFFMFMTGMGCGFLMPSTAQAVIAWFPVTERATVMGLKQTAVNIGGIITAATLPVIALALGWRYGFLILGIIAITIGFTALILYREPSVTSENAKTAMSPSSAVSLIEILKSREIWLLAFAGLCLSWVEMAMIAHLVLYLTEALVFGVVAAGGLLAMTEAAGAIARPIAGLVSDRTFGGRRRPVFILMAATSTIMCAVIGLAGPHLSWGIYAALVFLGMGSISFGGIWLTMLAEFGGHQGAGRAVGLGGFITLAGSTSGPPCFGYIVDKTGSYTWAWISLAVLAALCFTLLLFVREGKRKI